MLKKHEKFVTRYAGVEVFDYVAYYESLFPNEIFKPSYTTYPNTSFAQSFYSKMIDTRFSSLRYEMEASLRWADQSERYFLDYHFSKLTSVMKLDILDKKALIVSFFKDQKDLEREKITHMKLGKFVLYIRPEASPKFVAEIVEYFKEDLEDRILTFKVGTSREDFKEVYNAEMEDYKSPNTHTYKKNLADSCMQGYKAERGGVHASEAYASGDFEIISGWNENDELCVRCVAIPSLKKVLPIYTVDNSSFEAMTQHLSSLGYQTSFGSDYLSYSDFKGLKLLAIEDSCGRYVAPYLDYETDMELMGGYWYLGQGDINTQHCEFTYYPDPEDQEWWVENGEEPEHRWDDDDDY